MGNAESTIELSSAIGELIQLMKENPDRDVNELALGKKALDVFADAKFPALLLDRTQYIQAKHDLIIQAIEDLATGAPVLMSSAMGLRSEGLTAVPFTTDLNEESPGKMIFCIRLKDAMAFKDFKTDQDVEIHEQTTNAAIYYLIDLLASAESAN